MQLRSLLLFLRYPFPHHKLQLFWAFSLHPSYIHQPRRFCCLLRYSHIRPLELSCFPKLSMYRLWDNMTQHLWHRKLFHKDRQWLPLVGRGFCWLAANWAKKRDCDNGCLHSQQSLRALYLSNFLGSPTKQSLSWFLIWLRPNRPQPPNILNLGTQFRFHNSIALPPISNPATPPTFPHHFTIILLTFFISLKLPCFWTRRLFGGRSFFLGHLVLYVLERNAFLFYVNCLSSWWKL